MPKSLVPDDIRQAYLENVTTLKAEGKPVPDLVYDGVSYFADNKGAKWGGWRLRNRASHSAQGSKRRAQMRGAVASEDLYIEAFGEKLGKQRYLEDKAELKRIWGTRGKAGFDIDHIYPLAAGGQETPRNLMLREASANRGKGAKAPTPEQLQALLLSEDPLTQIQLQGPQPTPRKRAEILNLINEGGSVKFKRMAGTALPLAGLAAGVLGAGEAFAAGDPREGTARLLEAGAGEIPIAGDVVQPEAVAGGTFEDVQRRTAEGLRAKELQQRAAMARQRGGKMSFGLGGVRFTLPELGLSELMGIN
jgi:hypothetical protein